VREEVAMNRFLLPMLAALALAACGPNAAETMMSDYVEDLGRHMESLQAEETSHASSMTSSSTLDGMQGTEAGHWQRIEDHLDRMGLVMDEMAGCATERAVRIDTAGFADSVQKIRSECGAHRGAMQVMVNLATARTEEGRHARAIADRMMVMLDQWDVMMGLSRGYACSRCPHCGM
jgi:hypothetical protein